MKVKVKNLSGKVIEELELKPNVFEIAVNEKLLHQVYVSQYANQRHSKAHTKTRGELRGSTKKPWKQKGTGRARTGDVKNPIWRSGGTVFGPRNNRNYSQKINKKEAKLATLMAIVTKIKESTLIIVDNYEVEGAKTSLMAKSIKALKIQGSILMAFDKKSKKYARASRNLVNVKNIDLKEINVLEILNSKNLIMSKEGIKEIEKKYSNL